MSLQMMEKDNSFRQSDTESNVSTSPCHFPHPEEGASGTYDKLVESGDESQPPDDEQLLLQEGLVVDLDGESDQHCYHHAHTSKREMHASFRSDDASDSESENEKYVKREETLNGSPLTNDFSMVNYPSYEEDSYTRGLERSSYSSDGWRNPREGDLADTESRSSRSTEVPRDGFSAGQDKSSLFQKPSFTQYRTHETREDDDNNQHSSGDDSDTGYRDQNTRRQVSHQSEMVISTQESSFRPTPAPRQMLTRDHSSEENQRQAWTCAGPPQAATTSPQFTSGQHQCTESFRSSPAELDRTGVQQLRLKITGKLYGDSGEERTPDLDDRRPVVPASNMASRGQLPLGLTKQQTGIYPNLPEADDSDVRLQQEDRYYGSTYSHREQPTGLYPDISTLQAEASGDTADREMREEEEQAEEQRTVEVTELQEDDEEMCRLYFENTKRSGGGEIEEDGIVWDKEKQCFLVTFVDSKAAESVVSRKHTLQGRAVCVQLYIPPQCYKDRMVVSGVPIGTTEDCLQNYLECVANVSVTSVQLNSTTGKALIMMEPGQFDLKQIHLACEDSPLDHQSLMTFHGVPVVVSNTVLVHNLKPSTTKECISMFFQNKRRNAGGPVTRVEKLDETTARVYFEKHEDAEAVAEKGTHCLDGCHLQVTLDKKSPLEDETVENKHDHPEPMETDETSPTTRSGVEDTMDPAWKREAPEEDPSVPQSPSCERKTLQQSWLSEDNRRTSSTDGEDNNEAMGRKSFGTHKRTEKLSFDRQDQVRDRDNRRPSRGEEEDMKREYSPESIEGYSYEAQHPYQPEDQSTTRMYHSESTGTYMSDRSRQHGNIYPGHAQRVCQSSATTTAPDCDKGVDSSTINNCSGNGIKDKREFGARGRQGSQNRGAAAVYGGGGRAQQLSAQSPCEYQGHPRSHPGTQQQTVQRGAAHQHTTHRFGTAVIKEIKDKHLRKLTTYLKETVNGRFEWKSDCIIVTCIQPDAPFDWEMNVHKALDRFVHLIRVELGEGMNPIKSQISSLQKPPERPPGMLNKTAGQQVIEGGSQDPQHQAKQKSPVPKPQMREEQSPMHRHQTYGGSSPETTVDTISLKPHQVKFLSIPQAIRKVESVWSKLELDVDYENGILRMTTPQECIHKVKSEVLTILTNLTERKIPVSGAIHQMLRSAAARGQIQERMERRDLVCYWELQEDCILIAARNQDFRNLEDVFKSAFVETKMNIGENEASVMRSSSWKAFMEGMQRSDGDQPAPVLMSDLVNHVIIICDTPSDISKTRAAVMKFFDENKPEEHTQKFPLNHLKFLSDFCEPELRNLHDKAGELGVSLKINGDRLLVRGPRDGSEMVVAGMRKMVTSILSDKMTFKTSGAVNYLKGHKAQDFLQMMGHVTKCLVTVSDDQSSDGDGRAINASQLLAKTEGTRGQVMIVQGDITQCEVDAIVNAANSRLEHGGGVACAIVKAGGQSIQTECRQIVERRVSLKEGDVVPSGAGKLLCNHVLHAVGPTWKDGISGEDELLEKTVTNTLKLAQEMKITSIAMPAISCGIFRFPVSQAAMIIIKSIAKFFHSEAYQGCPDTVILIDMGTEPLKGFLRAAEIIFDKKLQVLAQPAAPARSHKVPPKSPRRADDEDRHSHSGHSANRRRDLPVKVVPGEIAKSKADVIVSTVHPSLDLRKGVLSKSILEEGGEAIQQELHNFAKQHGSARLGSVVRTKGGRLKCRSVFHLSLPTWRDDPGETLRVAVKKCMDLAKKVGVKSIAFPALGTGKLGYPSSEVVNIMNSVFEEWFHENPGGMKEVQVVVYPRDTETLQAFKNPEKSGDRRGGRHHGHSEGRGRKDRDSADARRGIKTQLGRVTVMVKQGNILNEPCDAVVNSSNDALDLRKGAVSKSILEACGDDILVECKKQKNEMEEKGVAATRVESGLGCGTIIHVSADRFKADWKRGILQALRKADELKLRSIALPALGTSMRGADPEELACTMKEAVDEFSSRVHSVREVRVIIFQQDMVAHYVSAFDQDASPRGAEAAARDPDKVEYADRDEKQVEKSVDVLIYSNKLENIKEAKDKIHQHMKENITERVIEDPLISNFRPDQQSAVVRLQMKHGVEIELKVRDGKVKVKGFEKNVMDACWDIKDIIMKVTKDRLKAAGMPPVRWQYEVGRDKFHDFDPENVITIEAAYKKKEPSVEFKDLRGRRYKIVFKDWREYSLSDSGAPSVKVRRRDLLQEKSQEIPLPSHWAPMKGEKVKLVDLNPNSPEYKKVAQYFGSQATIKKIERVQNPTLFQQYKVKKKELEQFNPKGTENEMRLWHGTTSDVVSSIITNGFNRSYCGKNGTALGAGVYFAANSSTSMGFARDGKMFQARVLTGEHTPGNGGMRVAPNKPNSNRPYDSVSGGGNPPGVFVIFHDAQAYPEYLLTF